LGFRNTQFWTPRPGEGKGIQPRRDGGSLGAEVTPGKWSYVLGGRIKRKKFVWVGINWVLNW
jgi:hypothetical protein